MRCASRPGISRRGTLAEQIIRVPACGAEFLAAPNNDSSRRASALDVSLPVEAPLPEFFNGLGGFKKMARNM